MIKSVVKSVVTGTVRGLSGDDGGGGPSGDALLLETGDFILLETGDFLLLE